MLTHLDSFVTRRHWVPSRTACASVKDGRRFEHEVWLLEFAEEDAEADDGLNRAAQLLELSPSCGGHDLAWELRGAGDGGAGLAVGVGEADEVSAWRPAPGLGGRHRGVGVCLEARAVADFREDEGDVGHADEVVPES